MPTTSTRSIALSLALHGAFLGFAARGAPTATQLRATASLAPLEAAISVDPTATPGPRAPSSPARASAVAAPTAPADGPQRERVRRTRVAAARARPVAPSAPSSETLLPSREAASRAAMTPRATHGPTGPGSSGAPGGRAPVATTSPAGFTGRAPGSDAGTAGGASQPASTGNGAAPPLLSVYLKGVRERVTRHREYPYLARRANLEGTVCLRVSIAASGRVLDVTPTCGTAQVALLQAALKSVSSAAPFPPLPAALGQRLTIDLPVVFELDSL